jgi:GNAT superfamily N-acetyltransferase
MSAISLKGRSILKTRTLERLVVATKQGWLIGVGGINVDPYLNDPATGRVRHVYVHSHFRRAGVGTAILQDLETDAVDHFGMLTLRTDKPEADVFYRASGFKRVHDNPLVTHRKTLR